MKRTKALCGSSLLFALALSACVDDSVSPRREGIDAGIGFNCVAAIASGTLACDWTGNPTLTRGPLQNVIVGGQGTYVNLIGDDVVWDPGQREWSVDIQIENLTGQPFATLDGDNPEADGTRIFIFRGPSGGVTLQNASGTGTFTAAGQSYMQYDGIIDPDGGVSNVETWTFSVPVGIEVFSFSVYLATTVPAPEQDLLDPWNPSPPQTGAIRLGPGGSAIISPYQDAILDATEIAVKVLVSGREWLALPDSERSGGVHLGNPMDVAGTKLGWEVQRNGGDIDFTIYSAAGSGFSRAAGSIARAALDEDTWYVVYMHYDPDLSQADQRLALLVRENGSSSNLLTYLVDQTGNMPQSGDTIGYIRLGGNPLGRVPYSGYEFDGVAVYRSPLPAGEEFAKPLVVDSDLVSLTYFEDGAGTSAANLVTGASSFVLSNHSWVEGSEWMDPPNKVTYLVGGRSLSGDSISVTIPPGENLAAVYVHAGSDVHPYGPLGVPAGATVTLVGEPDFFGHVAVFLVTGLEPGLATFRSPGEGGGDYQGAYVGVFANVHQDSALTAPPVEFPLPGYVLQGAAVPTPGLRDMAIMVAGGPVIETDPTALIGTVVRIETLPHLYGGTTALLTKDRTLPATNIAAMMAHPGESQSYTFGLRAAPE